MRSFISERKGILALLLLMIVLIVGRYDELFYWSADKVIEPYGDGFKAYTVIQYHAQHDSTYSFYQGMNYPYGDHVVPGATQPLVSNSLKFLSPFFGELSAYTIPIVNHSMLLSILLTAVFLFLIFKQEDLPDWYAVLAAIGITFLAPQTHRMTSHFGLTHSEVIPAVIYFLLRFSKKPSLKWSFAIAAVAFLYPLLHFYYFPIIVFLVSFYFLITFLRKWDWKRLGHYALHYGIQIGLPLVFFVYWLILNDPIEERSSRPWGFLYFNAKLQGTFTSLTQPHFQWINDHIISFGNLDFENKTYLGLIGILFFFLFLWQWIRRWTGGSDILPVITHKWPFDRLLMSAYIIFIFALGVPFVIPGLEFLIDYLGPIKQFRGIARFAWILFYLLNIAGFIYLFEWSRHQSSRWKKLVPIAALFILFFEAYHFSYAQDYGTETIEQMKEGQRYTDSNIDFSRYQAILPIPYYNIGSGNFWWPYDYTYSMQQSQVLSLQTGLAVTAAMLTRTAPLQAIKQLQLVLEPYRPPLILEDYPNDKPLLLLWDHYQKEREEYRDQYPHFENAGITLYDEGYIRLAELPLESFNQRIAERKNAILGEIQQDSLSATGEFLCRDSSVNYVYQPFDDLATDKPYLGTGGLMFEMPRRQIIFEGNMPAKGNRQDQELLLWMYIKRDLNTRSMLYFEEQDAQGQVVQQQSIMIWRTVQVIDDTGWAMIRFPFDLKNTNNKMVFSLENKLLRKKTFYLDELLIKPREEDLYKKTERMIWKNNRWFPL